MVCVSYFEQLGRVPVKSGEHYSFAAERFRYISCVCPAEFARATYGSKYVSSSTERGVSGLPFSSRTLRSV